MSTRSHPRKIDLSPRIPRTFAAMMELHPLRPIHDEVDLENATEILDMLAGHRLNRDQEDYLDALSTLVDAYEQEHHPVGLAPMSGTKALKVLVELHGLSGTGLAGLLGVHRSMGCKLLSGERELTAEHIKKLSACFKVSADLFLK